MGSRGGGDVAAEQYVRAKTSVWWDIENCQVPRSCDAHAIAQNISSALVNLSYCGPVSIHAYGDTTRIPSYVQQALSSTGISLNHVPAGVKDASDKKILVDMLFWAVDNPAPANYLLISGDRDFSNALHQLRMRRYSILLAQPQKASLPLVAAAKSVWLWTSLLAAGPPLSNGESQPSDNNGNISKLGSPVRVPDSIHTNQEAGYFSESNPPGFQKLPHMFKSDDVHKKPKQTTKNANQPLNARRPSSVSHGIQEAPNINSFHRSGNSPGKHSIDIHKLPSVNNLSNPASQPVSNTVLGNLNGNNLHGNYPDHHSQQFSPSDLPFFSPAASNTNFYHPQFLPPRPVVPTFSPHRSTSLPNVSSLDISDHPGGIHDSPLLKQLNGGESKENYTITHFSSKSNPQNTPSNYPDFLSSNPTRGLELMSSPSSDTLDSNIPGSKLWGTAGCPKPSEYVQGLTGVVLLALNTLRNERIMPTEANIVDCVHYGDLKHSNTDARLALASAIKWQMVVKHNLGNQQFYVAKNEQLWKCTNPYGGDPSKYKKQLWDGVQNFLASASGRSAIMASQCKYEAGVILKNACLKDEALGEVLQILNMAISVKKWIVHHPSGWQPVSILQPSDVACLKLSPGVEWQ